MRNSALRTTSLISAFQEFFAIIEGMVHFRGAAGHGAFILWGFETFLIFPNFLKSSSVIRQLVRKPLHAMFISNNRGSLHLW